MDIDFEFWEFFKQGGNGGGVVGVSVSENDRDGV